MQMSKWFTWFQGYNNKGSAAAGVWVSLGPMGSSWSVDICEVI